MIIGVDISFTACGVSNGERHDIISTSPRDGEESLAALRRRSSEVVDGVLRFIGEVCVAPAYIMVEAPMLRAGKAAGNHLYDLGWLMNDFISSCECEYDQTPILVPTLTLKKFVSGKGNTKKDEMKLAAYKKWGVEFARDPGCDKLHAFALVKYGEAVAAGKVQAVTIKRRGQNAA